VASHDTVKASVAYALAQRYGAMWVGSANGLQLDGYAGPQLRSAGSPIPTDSLGSGSVSGMTFDANGDLWTVGYDHLIRMYTPAQLATPGDTAAAIVIVDVQLNEPLSLAFDQSGNLWVGDADTLRAYAPPHLAAGGSQNADIRITSPVVTETPGLAFDANGNLWLSNFDNSMLVKYAATQLAASGAVDPVDTLRSIAALIGPGGIGFDHKGNLWVANHNTNTILMFTPSQLAASGSPTPPVIITTPATGSQMWGLAFDASGSLWVAASYSDTVMAFGAASLAVTGSPAPAVTLGASSGQFMYPSSVLFDPSLPVAVAVGTAAHIPSPRSVGRTAGRRSLRLPDMPFFQRR
jgi:sugar lactone lactonase YvrE